MQAGIQAAVFVTLTVFIAIATWWKVRQAPVAKNAAREVFLAGNGLTWPFIAGSLLLTNISCEQLVGMNGAQMMLVAWWEIGAVGGLLVLAHVLVPMYYRYQCTTTTELLERRLNDAGVRATVSVLFLLGYLFILLPVVLYTGSVFMQSMFATGIPIIVIAAAYALASFGYAALGGLRAIAVSDTYNGVALLVMGIAVLFFALAAVNFDLSGIPAERWAMAGAPTSDIPWTTLLTGMLCIHVFYWGTNMVIAQRVLAAGSVREAQKGIYAAAAFKIVLPLIVVLPGVIAYKLYGDVGDRAYGMLVAGVLPAWLAGAFAAMIFGAVVSSFTSCLNSAAALYTCDLHLKYVNPNANVKRVGFWVLVFFTVLPIAMVPLYQHSRSIIDMLQRLNGLYSMPVLAVFIVAVMASHVDGRAARAGLVFGSALYAVFTFVWSPLHYIHLMFITLMATIAFILLLSRLMPARGTGVLSARVPIGANP